MQQIFDLLNLSSSEIKTPCYLYSVSSVQNNFERLKSALGTKLIFSVKSNDNVDLGVRCAHFMCDGVEIASLDELKKISGGSNTRYINNPSADKNFLRAAIASKSKIVIDNIEQLKIVAEYGEKRPLQGVIIRLNSSVLSIFNDQHPKVRPDHFGMDWKSALAAIDLCKTYQLPLEGFHVFKGSYSFEKTAMATLEAAKYIINAMEERYAKPLSFINLGGGFSEHWHQSKFDFAAYRHELAKLPKHICVAHESGRGILANCGYFAVRVRYVKQIEQKSFVICDGGIAQNFLLAQTENLFAKRKRPAIWQKQATDIKGACTYVGSSCSKDDVIGQQSEEYVLPLAGNICVFDNCGAYNASYTVSPFLNLPQAKTYIVE
jgi:diaminopimelate decarboxylase